MNGTAATAHGAKKVPPNGSVSEKCPQVGSSNLNGAAANGQQFPSQRPGVMHPNVRILV